MSTFYRYVVEAQDESGDWYAVGLPYDDPRVACKRAEDFKRDFKGKRTFRVRTDRSAHPDHGGEG